MKALIKKSIKMKWILTNKITMKMNLKKTYQLMKMTGMKVKTKPLKKAKIPPLNLILIIAPKPQKLKNNNIKKVSNSTTK